MSVLMFRTEISSLAVVCASVRNGPKGAPQARVKSRQNFLRARPRGADSSGGSALVPPPSRVDGEGVVCVGIDDGGGGGGAPLTSCRGPLSCRSRVEPLTSPPAPGSGGRRFPENDLFGAGGASSLPADSGSDARPMRWLTRWLAATEIRPPRPARVARGGSSETTRAPSSKPSAVYRTGCPTPTSRSRARAPPSSVGDRHAAAPLLDELARDRQTEPFPARPAAGAPAVKPLEDGLLLARLEPGALVEDLDATRRRRRSSTRERAAVADRVLDQRVERAVEIRRRAPDRRRSVRPPRRARRRRRAAAFASARRPDRPPRRGRPLAGLLVLAGAAQDQKLVDHLREPVHLGQPRVEPLGSRSSVGRRLAQLLELQPQPGQRRAQLVGGVGDEVRWLRSSRATRSVISLKLRASERCSVLPSTGALASRSPAATGAPRLRAAESGERSAGRSAPPRSGRAPRTIAPRTPGRRSPRARRSLTASTLWVTPHRADRAAAVEDRHGGCEDLRAQGLAVVASPDRSCPRARWRSPAGSA